MQLDVSCVWIDGENGNFKFLGLVLEVMCCEGISYGFWHLIFAQACGGCVLQLLLDKKL